jgi:hypothetical protein
VPNFAELVEAAALGTVMGWVSMGAVLCLIAAALGWANRPPRRATHEEWAPVVYMPPPQDGPPDA